jgi:outer membrane protein OmpA-like peptidoglycan-associated protein
MGAMPRGPANDSMLGEFIDRETLRFVRDFPHPAALVWEALSDREQISRWLWPCVLFEARPGGRYRFEDAGAGWGGAITAFEPARRLELDMGLLFELFEEDGRCRLVLTLKRRRGGWSVMALAGYMGWLGRLTRLIENAPQEETERFASDIWEAMWPAYERMLRHQVTGGARAIYRLHFAPNDAALNSEARSHLDALVAVLHARADLDVMIDGFGEDPCSRAESIALCAARMAAAADYLRGAGIAPARILNGFTLGNYHPLVPNDTEAGRAFNRRIELRPTY